MTTRLLSITTIVLAGLIFGGNYYAARTRVTDEGCEKCGCFALVTLKNPDQKQKPSCSVVFRSGEKRSSSEPNAPLVYPLSRGAGAPVYIDLYACDYVLFCDKDAEAELSCRTEEESSLPFGEPTRGWQVVKIWGEQRCSIFCLHKGSAVRIGCDHWKRPAPVAPKPPVKAPPKPPVRRRPGELLSLLLGSNWQASSDISSFVPALFRPEPADENDPGIIIGDSVGWRLLSGEAGIDQNVLTVATGEAEARSFCTGDNVRLVGPNVLSLPTCQPDASGRWQGTYARPASKGTRQAVTVSLNLRQESESLRGEIQTADGTYNIVEGSQSGSNIRLQAERTGGTQGRITLYGRLSKGEIVFDGSEQSAGAPSTYGLTGFARRAYIAESALPIALINQNYSFTLSAFSGASQAFTFRVGSPAPVPPKQITWSTRADSLRERKGERFTYTCPANGSLSAVYGTDVYTDDSAICSAAVHAGLISRQTGGAVTIQIAPGAGSYTSSTRHGVLTSGYGAWRGSFIFVTAEADNSKRGRLPQGLSFNSQTGAFSGTPTELGTFEISVVATDGAGNVFEQPFALMVRKLVVTNGLLPDAFLGQPYTETLKVAGGQPPYRFSGNPPKGIQLDPSTGALSGTPSASSSNSVFEVTVRDSQNTSESQKLRLSVRSVTILNSHFLADAKVGVPYRMQFLAIGNLSPITWVFGRIDASAIGFSLNEKTGELWGTPRRAGNFSIDVQAESGSGSSSRTFDLTIK